MNKKGVEDVKKSKYFTLWDIIPYLCVLAVAVTLLLVFLLPEKDDISGFYVEYGDKSVLTYDFAEDKFDIEESFFENVDLEAENGGYTVTIITSDGKNVFFVDKEKRTVKMVDADCSFSKDCTYMPAIGESGDSIICVPHKLKIIAKGDGVSSPVTG